MTTTLEQRQRNRMRNALHTRDTQLAFDYRQPAKQTTAFTTHFNVIARPRANKNEGKTTARRRHHHLTCVSQRTRLVAEEREKTTTVVALTTCSRHCIIQSSANRRPASTCCSIHKFCYLFIYSSAFLSSRDSFDSCFYVCFLLLLEILLINFAVCRLVWVLSFYINDFCAEKSSKWSAFSYRYHIPSPLRFNQRLLSKKRKLHSVRVTNVTSSLLTHISSRRISLSVFEFIEIRCCCISVTCEEANEDLSLTLTLSLDVNVNAST